jgi:hypothetical protein
MNDDSEALLLGIILLLFANAINNVEATESEEENETH